MENFTIPSFNSISLLTENELDGDANQLNIQTNDKNELNKILNSSDKSNTTSNKSSQSSLVDLYGNESNTINLADEDSNKESNSNEKIIETNLNNESDSNEESTKSNKNKKLDLNEESTKANTNNLSTELNSVNLVLDLSNADEWILELDWSTNYQLVQLLSKFTRSLLIGDKIDLDNTLELNEDNSVLIKKLNNLPLKLDHLDDNKSCDLIINLNNKFRYEIMNQLIKNRYVAIEYRDLIDENLKKELIKENNDLITKLINLPAKFVDEKNSINRKRKLQISHEENEDETSNSLINELKSLKKEVYCLKKTIETAIGIRFGCELNNVKKFFEKDNRFNFEKFKYLDIEFRISIESKLITDLNEEKRYFGFYLQVNNQKDDQNNVNWQLSVNYELILKTNLAGKSDKIHKLDYVWTKSKGHGWNKFLSVDELFDLNNGYIRNNSISLEVYLKADKVIRDI